MSLKVQFSEYGTTDVLHVADVAAPTAGPGQVRVAVRAAGVNPADWKVMQGHLRRQVPLTFPAGLGTDVAGVRTGWLRQPSVPRQGLLRGGRQE
jgi:NADPH:quinone reductase-like Zn-dependent oxidoreductase